MAEDEGVPIGVHVPQFTARPVRAGVGEAVKPVTHDGAGAAEGLVKLHPPFTQTPGVGTALPTHELKS